MEFGKLPSIEGIDLTLPPDDAMTEKLWASLAGMGRGPVRLHVGCPVWGRKNWIGKIYPRGTKDKDFLAYYVKQFNTIELNSLFYALQPQEVIERWASLAGEGFRFCPKFSNVISHTGQLRNVQRDTDAFIGHVRYFGDRLGPSFLQLSDSFGPDRASLLRDYIRELPRGFSVCVELRQAGWFAGGGNRPVHAAPGNVSKGISAEQSDAMRGTWELLYERGIGTVITDTSGRRDVLHMRLTAPVAFIRFVSNNGHPTDFARIDDWVERIKSWIDKGLRDIYFFIHSHEEEHSPNLCRYAIGRFNERCGTSLQPPLLLENKPPAANLTLFD
jgi:uncharacterized protein YecE (DUF72 family)